MARACPDTWKTEEFVEIPEAVISKYNSVEIQERNVTVSSGHESVAVYLKEVTGLNASPKRIDVLFLHGASFTSQNWEDLNTLFLVGAMGHRAVAIDLPNYGKSHGSPAGSDFLATIIAKLELDRPVIVSPSMSGGVSIPFVLGNTPETASERVSGFVPIAPVGTGRYSAEQYACCPVPVMIVVGSNDKRLGETSTRDLMNFPCRERFEIQDAGHACYMNKPEVWQKLLYNFILALEKLKL